MIVFIKLFLKKEFIYFIYVNTLSLSSDTPEEGIGSHCRWLWATMWLLGIEFRTFGRAASALNCWAISPVPVFGFLTLVFSEAGALTAPVQCRLPKPQLPEPPPAMSLTQSDVGLHWPLADALDNLRCSLHVWLDSWFPEIVTREGMDTNDYKVQP